MAIDHRWTVVPWVAPWMVVLGLLAACDETEAEPSGVGPSDVEPSDVEAPDVEPRLEEALGSAAEEAAERSAGEGPACERAYQGVMAMQRGMHERMGGEGPPPEPPDRASFLQTCASLPPEVQRCLVMDHYLQNREACRLARERLEPAVQGRVQALMGR